MLVLYFKNLLFLFLDFKLRKSSLNELNNPAYVMRVKLSIFSLQIQFRMSLINYFLTKSNIKTLWSGFFCGKKCRVIHRHFIADHDFFFLFK